MKKLIAFAIIVLGFACSSFADEPQDQNQNVYQNNIVIVFDASGSMNDSIPGENGKSVPKIVAAKKALKQVLKSVPNDTNVGLFVFSSRARNDNPFPLAPKNEDALNTAIDSIVADGGTPLGEYIKKAGDQVLLQRTKQLGYGRYRILVVTDGEATDAGLMERVAPDVVRRGLSLDVIGVGMNNTHRLAQMSTSYRSANNSQALQAALVAIVAETTRTSTNSKEDDFALIAGLTDSQAKTILSTLSNTENQPILEKPKVEVPAVKLNSQAPATNNGQLQATTSGPNSASGGPSGLTIGLIVGGIILFILILILFIGSAN